jgi:hypothetical protein
MQACVVFGLLERGGLCEQDHGRVVQIELSNRQTRFGESRGCDVALDMILSVAVDVYQAIIVSLNLRQHRKDWKERQEEEKNFREEYEWKPSMNNGVDYGEWVRKSDGRPLRLIND